MFPFGLYLTGALVVLCLFGVLDPRKIGIPRPLAVGAALVLFVGYFFPPLIVGAWEFNVAGISAPVMFGAALLVRAKASNALIAFGAAALTVWAATRVETYAYGWLLLISAVASAALVVILCFAADRADVRATIGGLCLGAAVGEIFRCWTEIRRDGVLLTECGMGRYFDILMLSLLALAVVVPLIARLRRVRTARPGKQED